MQNANVQYDLLGIESVVFGHDMGVRVQLSIHNVPYSEVLLPTAAATTRTFVLGSFYTASNTVCSVKGARVTWAALTISTKS